VQHRIGALLPMAGDAPKFLQMYLYDTEHELQNRIQRMPRLDAEILRLLQDMIHEHNPYYHAFLTCSERLAESADMNEALAMVITSSRLSCIQPRIEPAVGEIAEVREVPVSERWFPRGRRHPGVMNAPQGSEVAAIIPAQSDEQRCRPRDIILERRGRQLMRISELDASYDPLHYVLLFPFGEVGWHAWLNDTNGKKITCKDYASFRYASKLLDCRLR
jgi:hypothetical protein